MLSRIPVIFKKGKIKDRDMRERERREMQFQSAAPGLIIPPILIPHPPNIECLLFVGTQKEQITRLEFLGGSRGVSLWGKGFIQSALRRGNGKPESIMAGALSDLRIGRTD